MIQKSYIYSFGLLRKIKLWKVLEVLVMWRQLTGNSFVRRKWENIEAPIGDIKNVVDWHEVNPHNVCNFTVSLIWNRHRHVCSQIWKFLAISRSSSVSKSVEIFWAEIYRGRLILGPNLVNRNYSAILATLQITSYVHSRNSS